MKNSLDLAVTDDVVNVAPDDVDAFLRSSHCRKASEKHINGLQEGRSRYLKAYRFWMTAECRRAISSAKDVLRVTLVRQDRKASRT